MLSSARAYAREVGSRNRFIKGDVTKMKIEGNFDTICLLGNALCHFSTHDFSRILQNTDSHSERGAYFIVDYRDIVRLMFDKKMEYQEEACRERTGKNQHDKGL